MGTRVEHHRIFSIMTGCWSYRTKVWRVERQKTTRTVNSPKRLPSYLIGCELTLSVTGNFYHSLMQPFTSNRSTWSADVPASVLSFDTASLPPSVGSLTMPCVASKCVWRHKLVRINSRDLQFFLIKQLLELGQEPVGLRRKFGTFCGASAHMPWMRLVHGGNYRHARITRPSQCIQITYLFRARSKHKVRNVICL